MSTSTEYPFNASIIKALNDKLYDKRKIAALEVERLIKEAHAANEVDKINLVIDTLKTDFAYSTNANSRKGGLIALAATSIALGQATQTYLAELCMPVLACFADQDSRVRYYACEALYNIAKVSRSHILLFFNDIFDSLSKLAADADANVKNGAELLDRLMKDIVTESENFHIKRFIPLLHERIYAVNPFVRQFLVSWLTILDSVPDIQLLRYLDTFLDGLFKILGDKNNDIRMQAETVLGEFLSEIKANPNFKFEDVVSVLVVHCQSSDQLTQLTATIWIKEFVALAGHDMLPFNDLLLGAILPCLAHEIEKIRETAITTNENLMRIIADDSDVVVSVSESKEASQRISRALEFDWAPTVNVLTLQFLNENVATRIAALQWILMLHVKAPSKLFAVVDELFPALLKTLSDPSDQVVLLDLEVLAEISSSHHSPIDSGCGKIADQHIKKVKASTSSSSTGLVEDTGLDMSTLSSEGEPINYFTRFMMNLLSLFSTDRDLLDKRGSFIVRQLCVLLDAEKIYCSLAKILSQEEDLEFASLMVQNLHLILVTARELFELRTRLKTLDSDGQALFVTLYRSWSHNPVATFSLCLLTQVYDHACDLIVKFSEMEVTVSFLVEVDKLVQLLESPIFVALRLQLLEPERYPYLIKSLYGLLMLLPQSSAFSTLYNRLRCVPSLGALPKSEKFVGARKLNNQKINIKFKELLMHFGEVQARHAAVALETRGHDDIIR